VPTIWNTGMFHCHRWCERADVLEHSGMFHRHRWCEHTDVLEHSGMFHLHRSCEQEYSKIQTPGNRQKERMQHSEHGESLKSRIFVYVDSFEECNTVLSLA
jgi:hypothetical protein